MTTSQNKSVDKYKKHLVKYHMLCYLVTMTTTSCVKCKHRPHCRQLCPPMEARANSNTPRREGLARDIIGADVEISSDYNNVLAELIEHHRQTHIIASHLIDTRSRAISAMLSADIPRREIARLLRMSYRQINRIIRNITD
jgi:hypothetical protein